MSNDNIATGHDVTTSEGARVSDARPLHCGTRADERAFLVPLASGEPKHAFRFAVDNASFQACHQQRNEPKARCPVFEGLSRINKRHAVRSLEAPAPTHVSSELGQQSLIPIDLDVHQSLQWKRFQRSYRPTGSCLGDLRHSSKMNFSAALRTQRARSVSAARPGPIAPKDSTDA